MSCTGVPGYLGRQDAYRSRTQHGRRIANTQSRGSHGMDRDGQGFDQRGLAKLKICR